MLINYIKHVPFGFFYPPNQELRKPEFMFSSKQINK